jgi:hypothetical protein
LCDGLAINREPWFTRYGTNGKGGGPDREVGRVVIRSKVLEEEREKELEVWFPPCEDVKMREELKITEKETSVSRGGDERDKREIGEGSP